MLIKTPLTYKHMYLQTESPIFFIVLWDLYIKYLSSTGTIDQFLRRKYPYFTGSFESNWACEEVNEILCVAVKKSIKKLL